LLYWNSDKIIHVGYGVGLALMISGAASFLWGLNAALTTRKNTINNFIHELANPANTPHAALIGRLFDAGSDITLSEVSGVRRPMTGIIAVRDGKFVRRDFSP
jgi:hypothetical protein